MKYKFYWGMKILVEHIVGEGISINECNRLAAEGRIKFVQPTQLSPQEKPTAGEEGLREHLARGFMSPKPAQVELRGSHGLPGLFLDVDLPENGAKHTTTHIRNCKKAINQIINYLSDLRQERGK